jgi:DNA-directed RNA polymerase specialized sigma24 family protein
MTDSVDTRRASPAAGHPDDALARELHTMLTALVERAPLFADLRRQGIAEDLVQDTLIAVTGRMSQGRSIDDPAAYAARCVVNLAKRTYLRGGREEATTDEALEQLSPRVEDVAERVDQRMTMREVLDMDRSVNTIIAELEPLELELVKAELARTDQKHLAATLGISRPTLYRRKGPAIAAFVTAVAQRAGTRPCTEHLGALLAAAGDSGFGAARAAAEHAERCDECRETIRHLTVARHGLAVIAPVPLVAAEPDPVAALDRLVAALHTVGDWARAIAIRTGDPTPLGGPSTKAVAIVAAACAGGGGVYCAVDGVPSRLTAPFSHTELKTSAAARQPAKARESAAVIRPAAQVIAGVTTTVRVVERHEAQAKAQAVAAAKRRSAERAAARRRAQAAREFALRNAAPAPATSQEFTPPPAPTTSTIVRREFATPTAPAAPTSPAAEEFGAP